MRKLFFIALLGLLVAMLFSGCSFMVGNQKVRLVPGTGVAPRTIENGDGETIYVESPAPEGDAFFLFFRGQL